MIEQFKSLFENLMAELKPPSSVALHLRAVARAIADLGVIHTQQNNRAHASAASQAECSALQILGELAVLPDMLDARQWVAFSGLDPRLFKSGKSVEKRPRISRGGSRHLRRALYMPALVALRRDPYLRRFYQNLLARGKARLQAVVAVMRKLLHALFAMFRTNQRYDGSKLCCAFEMAGHAIATRA